MILKEKIKKEYPPFSVAICVYEKDNAKWFDLALGSIINQTVQPDEIILVVDGLIPKSIQFVIDKYTRICSEGIEGKKIQYHVIKSEKQQGLGRALNRAVENAKNELIARMDSDDISQKYRFEEQLKRFCQEKDVAIVGGQIAEFIDSEDNIIGRRIVPTEDGQLKEYMKRRCPFNHMTVMFKKSCIQKVGGYKDWFWNEDYYLWIRMALANLKFGNLSETLVKVRVGKDMYRRRGGIKYFKSEIEIQRLMHKNQIIGNGRFVINCFERFIIQLLLPNAVRSWVFKKFARRRG